MNDRSPAPNCIHACTVRCPVSLNFKSLTNFRSSTDQCTYITVKLAYSSDSPVLGNKPSSLPPRSTSPITIPFAATMASGLTSRLCKYLQWLPVAILFSDTVATVHLAPDSNMDPQVARNTLCLVRRTKRPSAITHGHVVLVNAPHSASQKHLRRVIGVGGDYVRPSASHEPTQKHLAFVPPGFLWVEPDSASSNTARSQYCNGLVPFALVAGRVTHILPSGRSVPIIPSDRAYPSSNRQLYAPPH